MKSDQAVQCEQIDAAVRESVDQYSKGAISRRAFVHSLTSLMGSYTAAHLFLESTGLAVALISPREAQAANVKTESLRYASGKLQVEAYLAKPPGPGRYPAVLVIHENRGLNEHIRDVTRRFAQEGFLALAPDLLSRAGGTGAMKSPAQAADMLGRQAINDLLDDLKAGLKFLRTRVDVDPKKVASVGFCWGGWRSFVLATQVPELYRAVVFYGSTPEEDLADIKASVLAHYGEWDYFVTGNRLWTTEKMQAAGKSFQSYVYRNADHAFFNDTGPTYNAEAAKLAWQRTLAFLRS